MYNPWMNYRPILLLTLVIVLCTGPVQTHAASWAHFGGKKIGFTVQYPSNWRVTTAALPGATQISFAARNALYAVTITVLALKPGASMGATWKHFLAYERTQGNGSMGGAGWKSTRLGGRPARGGIVRLSTEGGVPAVNGYYVAPWRTFTYEVMIVSHAKISPRSLQQFPAIYRQMLQTWRFK
jgi:hypothetical protein